MLFMLDKLKDKWTHRKWSLYLFYDGILIKKVKITEDTIINEQVLNIRVYGHKTLFGKNIITLMVRPVKLLKTEEMEKRTYWGVIFEKGVDV